MTLVISSEFTWKAAKRRLHNYGNPVKQGFLRTTRYKFNLISNLADISFLFLYLRLYIIEFRRSLILLFALIFAARKTKKNIHIFFCLVIDFFFNGGQQKICNA